MVSALGAFLLVAIPIVLLLITYRIRRAWQVRKIMKQALAKARANRLTAESENSDALPSAPQAAPEFGPMLLPADYAEPLIREFSNTVAGVSFTNYDGKSRQEIIQRAVRRRMQLVLRPELNNPVVPGAIAVLTPNGEQIGYLKADLGDQVRRWVQFGYGVSAQILSTGKPDYDESAPIGVRFQITIRGHYKQRHIGGSFKKAVTDAKRAGQLEEAERMLMGEVNAQEEYALRFNDTSIDSWPDEQLAILYGQIKRPDDRLLILRRYCNLPGDRGTDLGLRGRLAKAEAAAKKLLRISVLSVR